MRSTIAHEPEIAQTSASPVASQSAACFEETVGQDTRVQPRSSLLGLVRNLKQEVSTLIQQEIKLAKTELSEKVQYFSRNGIALAIGGVIAYSGLIVLLIGLGFLAAWAIHLAGIQALFASFLGLLFIGIMVCGIGGALVLKGLSAFRKESLAPERTLHTLQELRGETDPAKSVASAPARPEPKVSSKDMQTQVEATEGEMGQTLEELGHRLDPRYLNAQVKHRIQENPYRAGLIAVGAGLLSGLMIRRRFRRA